MLRLYLRLLWPRIPSSAEYDYHANLAERRIRDAQARLEGTGYHERTATLAMSKELSYSLAVMAWRHPGYAWRLWRRLRRVRRSPLLNRKSL